MKNRMKRIAYLATKSNNECQQQQQQGEIVFMRARMYKEFHIQIHLWKSAPGETALHTQAHTCT